MRRYEDDLALRVTRIQRKFLEKYAEEHGVGICKAARACIDNMMKNEGTTA